MLYILHLTAVKETHTNSNPGETGEKEEKEQFDLDYGDSAWLFHVGPEPAAAGFEPSKRRVLKTAESNNFQKSSKLSSL